MVIDREYLDATISNLKVQEREASEMLQKCQGALYVCEALIARLEQEEAEEPSMTEDELKRALANAVVE